MIIASSVRERLLSALSPQELVALIAEYEGMEGALDELRIALDDVQIPDEKTLRLLLLEVGSMARNVRRGALDLAQSLRTSDDPMRLIWAIVALTERIAVTFSTASQPAGDPAMTNEADS